MSTIISQVKLYAELLDDGGTFRGDCPECGRSKTFTVTRQGAGYVYNCYSTHCALRGGSGVAVPADNLVRTKPVDKRPPFAGRLEVLSPAQRKFLDHQIGFQDRHIYRSGVKFAPVEDRYAFPILAPNGMRRGYVLRSYETNHQRKALTFMDQAAMDREEPHLSWYGSFGKSELVVVVEDIPSAVRASMHVGPVVAICGGGVGPDYVRELASHAKHVVWALDPDAFNTGINHHQRFGLSFESSRVLRLESDLKDLDEPSLTTVLKEIIS